jgi:hypothetical protein
MRVALPPLHHTSSAESLYSVYYEIKCLLFGQIFLKINFTETVNFLEAYLIPWSTVPPEKPIVTQLVKISPAFYGTRRLIIVFARARHWPTS